MDQIDRNAKTIVNNCARRKLDSFNLSWLIYVTIHTISYAPIYMFLTHLVMFLCGNMI